MDQSNFDASPAIDGALHVSRPHDSAHKHVTGSAEYIDDIPEPAGLLHGGLGLADRAHAEILSVDLEAVKTAPGVVWVITAADIPGFNDVASTGRHDEPLLATDLVQFHGQLIFAVIAETRDQARRAARLAKIEYRDLPHFTDIATARDKGAESSR
jgi:xanthine dehydrogenase large subunit